MHKCIRFYSSFITLLLAIASFSPIISQQVVSASVFFDSIEMENTTDAVLATGVATTVVETGDVIVTVTDLLIGAALANYICEELGW